MARAMTARTTTIAKGQQLERRFSVPLVNVLQIA
jgi:hypothetical protein